jgi:L-lactate utilization protein LutB
VKDYILRLAQRRGVKSIVKSKSMATEEIHLNKYLQEAGIDVQETDLGEWIIQLAGQTDCCPAVHDSRQHGRTAERQKGRVLRFHLSDKPTC